MGAPITGPPTAVGQTRTNNGKGYTSIEPFPGFLIWQLDAAPSAAPVDTPTHLEAVEYEDAANEAALIALVPGTGDFDFGDIRHNVADGKDYWLPRGADTTLGIAPGGWKEWGSGSDLTEELAARNFDKALPDLGTIRVGAQLSERADLGFDVLLGRWNIYNTVTQSYDIETYPGGTKVTFDIMLQDGTISSPGVDVFDPTEFDDGGTIANHASSGRAAVHLVYVNPKTDAVTLLMGQKSYNSLTTAKERFQMEYDQVVEPAILKPDFQLVGGFIATSDLLFTSDINRSQFFASSKLGDLAVIQGAPSSPVTISNVRGSYIDSAAADADPTNTTPQQEWLFFNTTTSTWWRRNVAGEPTAPDLANTTWVDTLVATVPEVVHLGTGATPIPDTINSYATLTDMPVTQPPVNTAVTYAVFFEDTRQSVTLVPARDGSAWLPVQNSNEPYYRGAVDTMVDAKAVTSLKLGDVVWVRDGGAAGNGALRKVIFDTTSTPPRDPSVVNTAWSGWYGDITAPITIDSTLTIDGTSTIDTTG